MLSYPLNNIFFVIYPASSKKAYSHKMACHAKKDDSILFFKFRIVFSLVAIFPIQPRYMFEITFTNKSKESNDLHPQQ